LAADLSVVIVNNMNLKQKIEHCLTKYPETRNSDVLLTRAVWHEFHNSKIFKHNDKPAVYLEDMMDLPREDNVKRWRAKIQNEEHKFLPTSEEVCRARKIEEFWWHGEMSKSNPALG
jgi:hypothetical protein